MAYATVYFKDMGVDLAVIGMLAAVPALVAIVAAPAWGVLADRLGDMRPPYLAGALWAAGAALLLVLGPPMTVLGLGLPWTFGLMYFFDLQLTLGNIFGIPLFVGFQVFFYRNHGLHIIAGSRIPVLLLQTFEPQSSGH